MVATLPDCRVRPKRVEEMQVADVVGVLPWNVWTDLGKRPVVRARAFTAPVGHGCVTICRLSEDEWSADLSNVPGYRFPQKALWRDATFPIAQVTGIGCG